MDPSTGKVLALAVYPSFNPNQFLQYRAKAWRNRAIADTFEPGSMFKTFLAAAALEEKIVRPTDSFYCENGSYTVYDRTIHDHLQTWMADVSADHQVLEQYRGVEGRRKDGEGPFLSAISRPLGLERRPRSAFQERARESFTIQDIGRPSPWTPSLLARGFPSQESR